jgi:hypothetical protein
LRCIFFQDARHGTWRSVCGIGGKAHGQHVCGIGGKPHGRCVRGIGGKAGSTRTDKAAGRAARARHRRQGGLHAHGRCVRGIGRARRAFSLRALLRAVNCAPRRPPDKLSIARREKIAYNDKLN